MCGCVYLHMFFLIFVYLKLSLFSHTEKINNITTSSQTVTVLRVQYTLLHFDNYLYCFSTTVRRKSVSLVCVTGKRLFRVQIRSFSTVAPRRSLGGTQILYLKKNILTDFLNYFGNMVSVRGHAQNYFF